MDKPSVKFFSKNGHRSLKNALQAGLPKKDPHPQNYFKQKGGRVVNKGRPGTTGSVPLGSRLTSSPLMLCVKNVNKQEMVSSQFAVYCMVMYNAEKTRTIHTPIILYTCHISILLYCVHGMYIHLHDLRVLC